MSRIYWVTVVMYLYRVDVNKCVFDMVSFPKALENVVTKCGKF